MHPSVHEATPSLATAVAQGVGRQHRDLALVLGDVVALGGSPPLADVVVVAHRLSTLALVPRHVRGREEMATGHVPAPA